VTSDDRSTGSSITPGVARPYGFRQRTGPDRRPRTGRMGHQPHRGAQLIPQSSMDSGEGLAKVPRDRMLVLYCKTGVRSAQVLAAVKKAGFAEAVHLQGGSWPGPSSCSPTW